MRRIKFLQSALEDMDYIHEHYAHKRGLPDIADKVLTNIFDETENILTEFPSAGKNLDYYQGGFARTACDG